MTIIRYSAYETAWADSASFVKNIILNNKARRVLEVGAGANPAFSIDFIRENGISYTLLDISSEELKKAPPGYSTVHADIASADFRLQDEYDVIFSRHLAEHLRDGKVFHKNVFSILAPGGIVFHYFPTLYALPFVVNRLLPERLSGLILSIVQAGREKEGKYAKFPAFYSWCRGPIKSQIRRFESLGYNVDEYIGFFGYSAYYDKVPLIKKIHINISDWLIRHPIPLLTSFSYVVLSKKNKS